MRYQFIIYVLVFASSFQTLLGQDGVISGTVYDAETGETLIASYVEIIGIPEIVEATDFDGKFSMTIAPGIYSLKATYIGYADLIVEDVVVTNGNETIIDMPMGTDNQLLEEVVVTAKAVRNTENYILLERKKSDKIQDGIGRRELSQSGVSNVAGAMTKVTGISVTEGRYINVRGLGDRYSVTQLNGINLPSIDPYRNSAQLDLIPSNLVENLVVSKTFTPDLPGNFTGGLLNVETRDFPEQQTFTVSYSANYNTFSSFNDDFLTFDDGSDTDWLGYGTKARQLPSELSDPATQSILNLEAPQLLSFGRLSEEETIALADDIDNASSLLSYQFDTMPGEALLDQGFSLSYGNSFDLGESQLGVIFTGGYKIRYRHKGDNNLELQNDKGALFQRWQLFDINNDELLNRGNYVQQQSLVNPIVNGLGGLAYKIDDFNSIDLKVMYNHNTNKTTGFLYGQDGNNIEDNQFQKSRSLEFVEREMINYQLAGRHVFTTIRNLEVDWNLGLVNASLDEPELRFFNSQIRIEDDGVIEGIPLSNLNRPFYFWRGLEDETRSANLNIEYPFVFFGRSANSVKIGGSFFRKERAFFEERYRIENGVRNDLTNGFRFRGDFDEFFQEENIGVVGVDEFPNFDNYLLGLYPLYSTIPENSYDAHKEITAAYAMTTLNVTSKLKAIVGARFEHTDIFVETRDTLGPDSTRIGSINVNDILPSASLIYALTDQMNMRASFSRTLARPSLREIAPFSSFDPRINQFNNGNPNLVTTDILNFDLRYEWFFGIGEIFSVSAYYKDFTNPITVFYLPSSNLEFRYENVESGNIAGLEFELRKKLDLVAPFLKDFKFNTNFSFIRSEMDAPEDVGTLAVTERPFEGQSDFLVNGGLIYNNVDMGIEATVQVNYFSDRLIQIGQQGTPDIFEKGRTTLDFIASKKLGKVDIQVSAQNLLNPNILFFQEFRGSEYIVERFNPGANFGLGVTYSIF